MGLPKMSVSALLSPNSTPFASFPSASSGVFTSPSGIGRQGVAGSMVDRGRQIRRYPYFFVVSQALQRSLVDIW